MFINSVLIEDRNVCSFSSKEKEDNFHLRQNNETKAIVYRKSHKSNTDCLKKNINKKTKSLRV